MLIQIFDLPIESTGKNGRLKSEVKILGTQRFCLRETEMHWLFLCLDYHNIPTVREPEIECSIRGFCKSFDESKLCHHCWTIYRPVASHARYGRHVVQQHCPSSQQHLAHFRCMAPRRWNAWSNQTWFTWTCGLPKVKFKLWNKQNPTLIWGQGAIRRRIIGVIDGWVNGAMVVLALGLVCLLTQAWLKKSCHVFFLSFKILVIMRAILPRKRALLLFSSARILSILVTTSFVRESSRPRSRGCYCFANPYYDVKR